MRRFIVVTALMAEAVPLIDFYRMKKQPKQAHFHLFHAPSINSLAVDLLVCGMGADNMKKGLKAYMDTLDCVDGNIWLNVGIAGALSRVIGELIWVNSIADVRIGQPVNIQNTEPIDVRSMSRATTDYRAGILFDMEAETWLQCIAENTIQFEPERLFCAKVVSDNPDRNTHKIDKHWVTSIMRKNINELNYQINNLIKSTE